jgi:carbon-monoxide dehydrogenase large subunit
LTQNFKKYLIPTAVEVPHFTLGHMVTPAPFSPGGFNGAGETGTVTPPPCLANAVEDALRPLGVEVRNLPLKPIFSGARCAVQNQASTQFSAKRFGRITKENHGDSN